MMPDQDDRQSLPSLSSTVSSVPIPSFQVGRVYHRSNDIHDQFGGSRQSGISPSGRVPAIFLFTGDSGEQYGYKDHQDDDGTFYFTGEGQQGDMSFTRGNLAIRDHSSVGKALHLFKTLGKGKGQRYLGEFVYRGHTFEDALDAKKKERKAIVFQLIPCSRLELLELSAGLTAVGQLTLEEARTRALTSAVFDAAPPGRRADRTIYERSEDVRRYVLMRANGRCELCEQPAPFLRPDGSSYLEPHHTTRVSDGGPDHPRFVAALCPSCHREVHYGAHAQAKNGVLKERLAALEAATELT